MEIVTEMISLSKIRDGLFIGDSRAGTNLDLLMQFKISHIINASGIPLPYSFESIGIKYLTINWQENPPEDEKIINEEIISNIISFIDESDTNGEGLLGFSVSGKNRICAVIILYLITKYNWPLKKCLEYVKKKKKDMEINTFYMNQLENYEKNYFSKNNNFKVITDWNNDKIKDNNELLMKNTYINEEIIKNNKGDEEKKNNNKYKIIRNVEWGDNKKLVKQMAQPGLIHYNIDNDLFLKKYIEDITDHLNKKPLRSCIKNYAKINASINLNKINTTNKRKKSKIYLAADTNSVNKKSSFSNYKNKNNYLSEKKEDNQNENVLLTQINDNNQNKLINDEKKNIFEDIMVTEKNDENNDKIFEENIKKNKNTNKINENQNKIFFSEKNTNCKNQLVNNLEIITNNNDSDDDFKINVISIENKNKRKKSNKNENKKENKKENQNEKTKFGFNIINIEAKNKPIHKDLNPIISKLLKFDPNLETLNNYLKNHKKKSYVNYLNTLPNFQINSNKMNIAQKNSNLNKNLKSDKKNMIKNNLNIKKPENHLVNKNTLNLIPINLHNNSNNNFEFQNKKIKPRSKEEKKKTNKLYIQNLNLNIENNNTINNKSNKVFNKKFNNFFMDAFGNYSYGFMNKKRNNYSERIKYTHNGNNGKFLSPNTNYYLANSGHYKNKEFKNKENTIIPEINKNFNNYKFHSSNSQKNTNKNPTKNNTNKNKNKIFINPTINIINKNNSNNITGTGMFITNIINSNNFKPLKRKESKYFYIIFILIF